MGIEKLWKIRPSSPGSLVLARDVGITPLQAQLLINRGVTGKSEAERFLSDRLADMNDPMLLKDMPTAVESVMRAIHRGYTITIYGDYDADGITGTALLVNFFRSLGIPVSSYIPDRLTEGYGLNKAAVREIAKKGKGLIITVDCGSSDSEEVALAKELGLEVIVTDHHQVYEANRPSCVVVNPHRKDCPYPFKDLAGVGVAFMLAISVRAALRNSGWFRSLPEPDLREYLDLVALGTVADQVSLVDQNRIFVKAGLRALERTQWVGLKALEEVSDIRSSVMSASDLAFRLAPRLNAPGRMGRSELGIRILTVQDPHSAAELAAEINVANSRRQRVEETVLHEIEADFEGRKDIEVRRILLAAGEGWHPGVLGIVASRLVDKYHRPSLVFSLQGSVATGSARSIGGFNLYWALNKVEHLLDRFGGHTHAAGLALRSGNLGVFEKQMETLAQHHLADQDLVPSLEIDAEIPLSEITPTTLEQMEALSPFGKGNPEPVFLSRSVHVKESEVIGDRHVRLWVEQGGRRMDAIGFGLWNGQPLRGSTVNLLFTPQIHRWQGYDTIRLRVIDLERCEGERSRLILENAGC